MLSIKEVQQGDFEICFYFDSNTIALWNRKQWKDEMNKKGVKVFALFLSNKIIGICTFQKIIDEVHINYFSVNKKYRRNKFGTYLMNYLIGYCEKLNVKKLLLEVSKSNKAAKNFYGKFDFIIVGIRKNYYKDGSDALLKEKKIN